ncbi:MAG: betC 5 [Planctomycetaceae bacterium]|nr:betC 5 [Planctomycetaceae bacterium]
MYPIVPLTKSPMLLLFFTAVLFAIGPTAYGAEPGKLNVLLMFADDLNCDLHCYGHPRVKTPNLDRLAARGVLFERAYCQFPLCSPSRSSFLTGRRPNTTRVHRNPGGGEGKPQTSPHFREAIPETITLPQLFRNNGYYAARVGKLYHYGVPAQIGTNGFDDPPSWEQAFNPSGRDKAEEDKIFTLIPKSYGAVLSWLAAEGTDAEQTDGLIAAQAVKVIEQQRDKPFFLGVGFFRPHTPYVAPKKYFDLYKPDEIKLAELSADDQTRTPAPAYASAKKEQENLTVALRQEAIQAYWASISFMDAQVGLVLDGLDRSGLTDKTLIVFSSDHGYHLSDHGLWQKMSLFERSSRVPLIIAGPGIKAAGKTSTSLAELVDIYPTLADLAGLPTPDYLEGKSLKPVLNDPTATVKSAAFTQVRRGEFDGYAVRTDRFRYITWEQGRRGEQLFDLQADPRETKNLAHDPAYATTVAEMKQRIEGYSMPVTK